MDLYGKRGGGSGYKGKLTPQRIMGVLRKAGFAPSKPRQAGWRVSVVNGSLVNRHADYEGKVYFDDPLPPRLQTEATKAAAAEARERYAEALRAAGLKAVVEGVTVYCWEDGR